jgi:hypothetical protein
MEYNLRMSKGLADRILHALRLHEPSLHNEFYPLHRAETNRIERQKMEWDRQKKAQNEQH